MAQDHSVQWTWDSDTESSGSGFTLDACPHDGSMTALALHDPLAARDKPKRGPRKMSKNARAQRARRPQRHYWEGTFAGQGGPAPALAIDFD